MRPTVLESVIDRIERDFEIDHLGRVSRYLAQPSISALSIGIQEMVELLVEDIERYGGTAEIVNTSELPVVFGLIDEGADKTLILHGL